MPEDVYEQLETDEQEKFSGCDLTNWMDEEFVVEEHGVEADELNELWQRKFYDSSGDEESKWYGLGGNKAGGLVDEVHIFNC